MKTEPKDMLMWDIFDWKRSSTYSNMTKFIKPEIINNSNTNLINLLRFSNNLSINHGLRYIRSEYKQFTLYKVKRKKLMSKTKALVIVSKGMIQKLITFGCLLAPIPWSFLKEAWQVQSQYKWSPLYWNHLKFLPQYCEEMTKYLDAWPERRKT